MEAKISLKALSIVLISKIESDQLKKKQKTRLHHQHKDWERNYRDYNTKIQKINEYYYN